MAVASERIPPQPLRALRSLPNEPEVVDWSLLDQYLNIPCSTNDPDTAWTDLLDQENVELERDLFCS
ncbi:hypothetical protein EPUS_06700 [Endocarpon pusillum Z07020]|uniref:Uncharacterized protein n=1 Tax=Endocarpon pusillum (strain Z07020 / HMAS-L-300199) TaxID=1263415 RepID=U1GAG7_ENDPU|nr:uncharacterized protein EPUS_06700 [Endocarpon pusillum Z07020]ERF69013.1 hypothetical protein EPUS_06700 [Endocarpon pusillum Z07020]